MRERALDTSARSSRSLAILVCFALLAPAAAAQGRGAREAAPPTLPPEIDGARIAHYWSFDRDGDGEGWIPFQNVAPLEVRAGVLHVKNEGPDPYITGPDILDPSGENQFFALRMRTSSEGLTQFFWSRREAPDYREAQMVPIVTKGDGEWHVYEVDLRGNRKWTGEIENLRIDPVNGIGEEQAEVEIDWIALYQTPAQVRPLLPHWKDERTLVLGFENHGGQDAPAPVELSCDGRVLGHLPCLESPGTAEALVDASALPERFTIDATLAGERIWRGRIVKPRVAEPGEDGAPSIVIGRGAASLALDARRRVTLSPLANLTVRGPGKSLSYFEFDLAQRGDSETGGALDPGTFEEALEDPWLGTLHASATIEGTEVRLALEASIPLSVLRFEGPRLLQGVAPTHTLFPGLEYLERGEDSSREEWTGPADADRSVPERTKISVPMIAFEYDRTRVLEPRTPRPVLEASVPRSAHAVEAALARGPAADAAPIAPVPPGSPDSSTAPGSKSDRSSASGPAREGAAWVAALAWDVENRSHSSTLAPAAELVAKKAGFSYATVFLPSVPEHVDENTRYARRPYELPAFSRLELAVSYVIAPGALEDVFAEYWTHAVPPGPTLAWAGEDVPEAERYGPGSRDAIEHVIATSMLAYSRSLFDPKVPGWKTHIAIGEAPAWRENFAAIVLGEGIRSGRSGYATAVGIPADAQIEKLLGGAESLVDGIQRARACEVIARMQPDGGIPYEISPEMVAKVRAMSGFYGLDYDTLGIPGESNSGLTAIGALPLLEYAACTRDELFVAAAARALEKINSYTVPRGSQIWEIHMQTPDLFAAALGVLCNVWGWRMSGDPAYLDHAQRWARTGVPFFYLWEPPDSRRVRSVHVADQNGEGPVLAERDPSTFYRLAEQRQVNPYASLPVFGTSWYSVTWLGIPVQWCGLAWGNAIRELDLLRPCPELVRLADGAFRSAANQQADQSYLAGTLPDSWDVATALSRQPFIVPERILEYAYRVVRAPYVDATHYVALEGEAWTHAASRALLAAGERRDDSVAIDARFFAGQNASVLVGGKGPAARVRVNGRELARGTEATPGTQWIPWGAHRGVQLVRWVATGEDDRIELDSR